MLLTTDSLRRRTSWQHSLYRGIHNATGGPGGYWIRGPEPFSWYGRVWRSPSIFSCPVQTSEHENDQAKWGVCCYLWDIHCSNSSTGTSRSVYGAVVGGKRIVFYKYFYGVQEVRRWRLAREGNFYYRKIEEALNWIQVRQWGDELISTFKIFPFDLFYYQFPYRGHSTEY